MGRADLAGRIDTVERRMDSIELRWDASFAELSTQILRSNRETREAILATLRGEVAGEFSGMRADMAGEFSAVRAEVAGEFSAMRADMAGEFSAVRAHFESVVADGESETRRYMRVLYEDILSRIALLGEGRPSSS
jgi:hypothetical protein